MRDRDLAFESSEAGLRNGERIIDSQVAAPADRRLREVFTATASIRNRVRVN
jgi:Tfp pilus assembly protein PilX